MYIVHRWEEIPCKTRGCRHHPSACTPRPLQGNQRPDLFHVVAFQLYHRQSIDLLSLYDLPIQFNISNNSRFEDVFSQYLVHASNPNNIIDYIMAEAKGIELIGELLESAIGDSESKLYRCSNGVFLEMLSDILEQPVHFSNLDIMADKYHLHPTYISNQFKKYFKISPVALSRKICLGKAQQMLTYDSLSINEIATRLGYEEPGNFTRFFKMKIGITPQQYRTDKNRSSQTLAHAAFYDSKI